LQKHVIREREGLYDDRDRDRERISEDSHRKISAISISGSSNALLSSIFAIGVLAMALAAIVVPYQSGKDVVAVVSTSMSGE